MLLQGRPPFFSALSSVCTRLLAWIVSSPLPGFSTPKPCAFAAMALKALLPLLGKISADGVLKALRSMHRLRTVYLSLNRLVFLPSRIMMGMKFRPTRRNNRCIDIPHTIFSFMFRRIRWVADPRKPSLDVLVDLKCVYLFWNPCRTLGSIDDL